MAASVRCGSDFGWGGKSYRTTRRGRPADPAPDQPNRSRRTWSSVRSARRLADPAGSRHGATMSWRWEISDARTDPAMLEPILAGVQYAPGCPTAGNSRSVKPPRETKDH